VSDFTNCAVRGRIVTLCHANGNLRGKMRMEYPGTDKHTHTHKDTTRITTKNSTTEREAVEKESNTIMKIRKSMGANELQSE
jgi:hypothetical protein